MTALLEDRSSEFFGHGDGLAAFRGILAHRAIQVSYGPGTCPPLIELARQFKDRPIPEADLARVAAEVGEYLERFATTPLALALSSGTLEARFEVPFAWDWDGVPVHGTVDLIYREHAANWHVVDFKTDSLDGRTVAEAAAPYIAQVGLYGMALERAVGTRPSLALCFLRTGEVFDIRWADVVESVNRTRNRVDRGMELLPSRELGPNDG